MVNRRPAVNPKPVGFDNEGETYEQMLAKTCPCCYIIMTFIRKLDTLKCLSCGFEPARPDKEEQKAEKQEEDI